MKEFVKQFTKEKLDNVIEIDNVYYETNPELEKLNLKYQRGIPLGYVKKGKFKPSLYLLEKLSSMTKNKVFITEKAQWLFLCGRDVFMKNVTKDNSNNNIFLVQNKYDENLGFALKGMSGKDTIIKNLQDRGDFLRREKS